MKPARRPQRPWFSSGPTAKRPGWRLDALPVNLLAISGHKIGAPKGIGALFVRRGTPMQPLFYGGSQDRGRRPGT